MCSVSELIGQGRREVQIRDRRMMQVCHRQRNKQKGLSGKIEWGQRQK